MEKHSNDPMCDRIIHMTHLLCSGKRVVQEEMAEKFGVHKRTIYRDLLKIGKHVEIEKKKKGYKILYYYKKKTQK